MYILCLIISWGTEIYSSTEYCWEFMNYVWNVRINSFSDKVVCVKTTCIHVDLRQKLIYIKIICFCFRRPDRLLCKLNLLWSEDQCNTESISAEFFKLMFRIYHAWFIVLVKRTVYMYLSSIKTLRVLDNPYMQVFSIPYIYIPHTHKYFSNTPLKH